ncbi:hypothetical protein EVAR_4685_1 [Eumeta japonica]|uniref:Uncharacterized protein n=1 Tax=Eumeta variegata TaxID=151549 RepID=A0A4C1WPE9_EUMVA|nr:hypothetical protein EVAR_4685_1 [Eumeta japonica]
MFLQTPMDTLREHTHYLIFSPYSSYIRITNVLRYRHRKLTQLSRRYGIRSRTDLDIRGRFDSSGLKSTRLIGSSLKDESRNCRKSVGGQLLNRKITTSLPGRKEMDPRAFSNLRQLKSLVPFGSSHRFDDNDR